MKRTTANGIVEPFGKVHKSTQPKMTIGFELKAMGVAKKAMPLDLH